MIDLVLLAIIGVSALLGLIRGFVGILVSTAAWLLAGLASFQFGADAATWLSDGGRPTVSETFGGYALTFVVVLLAVGLAGALLKSMVRASQLSGTDRGLGFALGLVRGAFFACVLVLLMGFTPLPREPSWRQSQVLPLLLPGAGWMRARLPDWSVPDLGVPAMPLPSLSGSGADFRNALPAGDNGGVAAPGQLLEGAMRQAVDSARDRISGRGPGPGTNATMEGDPVNVENAAGDPANVENAGTDPASVETARSPSSGRARPPSQ
jgi:membrane protein required for colicin V production